MGRLEKRATQSNCPEETATVLWATKIATTDYHRLTFSYRPIFRCQVFRLPNFPFPFLPDAVFSVALFPSPLFLTNFLSPFFPTLLFLLPNFQVAQFSNSPNFGSRFYRCPLCRESFRQLLSKLRAHVQQGSQRSQTPPRCCHLGSYGTLRATKVVHAFVVPRLVGITAHSL